MSAKDIVVKPITSAEANAVVKRNHYSGKVVGNSQVHMGVFYNGKLEGAMQFGPSLDKSKTLPLVEGTAWNGMLELNRMAFSDALPPNSESRAISVAMRIIKKQAPHIEWILSFADGSQCGDGTIYRASGFSLIGIKKNTTILQMPDGSITTDLSLNLKGAADGKKAGYWKKNGAKPLGGFQLRYIYFINPKAKERLTVPILPFSAIDAAGARMYKGSRGGSKEGVASDFLLEEGGSIPTPLLQPLSEEVVN